MNHSPVMKPRRAAFSVDHSPSDVDRRMAALEMLLDVALQLSGAHSEDAILAAVTQGACAAVPCERASLFLLDEQTRDLYTRTVTQLELREIRISMDRGVIGWVARKREVTSVAEPKRDPRWDPSFDQQTGFVTRNILAVPVLAPVDGRLLGVLQLLNTNRSRFDGFDEQVAQAFAAHAATALERSRLQREAQRAAEMRREMELARRIQRSFLPERMPAVEGYEIAAWWQPAEFVSGDYYDWFPLSDQRLGLVVGDVCGHGMGPSLIMASLRAMLHVLSKRTSDPEEMLALLAATVTQDLKETQFVTFLIAALDLQSHTVRFANAGHAPALHFGRRQNQVRRLEPTQLPLGFPRLTTGIVPDTIALAPGDLLLLGTDGIIEARNQQGELFGLPRLVSLVQQSLASSAAELAVRISAAIPEFQGCFQMSDDATLLIVERKPS